MVASLLTPLLLSNKPNSYLPMALAWWMWAATALTVDQEWQRLEPVLRALLPLYPGKISLDSYHPETFRRAFEVGQVIVNDVTGMNNSDMVGMVAELRPTVIVSHLPGADIQPAHQNPTVSTVGQVRQDLLVK